MAALAKYEVIADRFWMGYGEKGGQIVPKGGTVELDPDLVRVSTKSLSLKPLGNAPVFDPPPPAPAAVADSRLASLEAQVTQLTQLVTTLTAALADKKK